MKRLLSSRNVSSSDFIMRVIKLARMAGSPQDFLKLKTSTSKAIRHLPHLHSNLLCLNFCTVVWSTVKLRHSKTSLVIVTSIMQASCTKSSFSLGPLYQSNKLKFEMVNNVASSLASLYWHHNSLNKNTQNTLWPKDTSLMMYLRAPRATHECCHWLTSQKQIGMTTKNRFVATAETVVSSEKRQGSYGAGTPSWVFEEVIQQSYR